VLNDEGAALFKSLAAGKPGDALLLVKADGSQWGKSHQARPMEDACERAKIMPPASIHILRLLHCSSELMGHKRPTALQKRLARPRPQGQTYSPNFDRLSIKRLREMKDATA
jgi:hypothetical protein